MTTIKKKHTEKKGRKKMKLNVLKRRITAFGLAIMMSAGSVIPAAAAATPSIINLRASNITTSQARVDFTTNNPGKLKITNCGLQVRKAGTGTWKTKTDTVAKKYWTYSKLNSYYFIGSGKEVNLKLAAGTKYEYRGFTKAGGKTIYSATKTFTTAKAINGKTYKLSYNKNLIQKIGKQPKGSVYCSVYAMSYARVIRGLGYSKPLSFWSDKGAAWWKGNMKSKMYDSQQNALKAVYDQITAGKPAIIYVYGPNAKNGHYVTVFGYKNVTNTKALKMSNFVILDPDAYSKAYERDLSIYTGARYISKKGYQVIVF